MFLSTIRGAFVVLFTQPHPLDWSQTAARRARTAEMIGRANTRTPPVLYDAQPDETDGRNIVYVRAQLVGGRSDAGDSGAGSVPSGPGAPSSAVSSFGGCLALSTRHAISVWMTLALRWPLRLSRHGDGHAVLCWSGMTEGSELTRA